MYRPFASTLYLKCKGGFVLLLGVSPSDALVVPSTYRFRNGLVHIWRADGNK